MEKNESTILNDILDKLIEESTENYKKIAEAIERGEWIYATYYRGKKNAYQSAIDKLMITILKNKTK